MLQHLIVTVVTEDKPGVVEALASTVSDSGGNWLESHLAQLSGKFAGVIHVAVPEEDSATLEERLSGLSAQNIDVTIDRSAVAGHATGGELATFSALGPDRPGIVREISQAFAQRGINLEELVTEISSTPYSGDPLFKAHGEVRLPDGLDLADLHETLDEIADNLAMDISLQH